MDSPTIIRAAETNKEQVKGVLKLGFANDALLRWVFPDAKAYLESFDHWMEEYSKISFKHDICFAEASFAGASVWHCLLYTSPSPRDDGVSRMPSSA